MWFEQIQNPFHQNKAKLLLWWFDSSVYECIVVFVLDDKSSCHSSCGSLVIVGRTFIRCIVHVISNANMIIICFMSL